MEDKRFFKIGQDTYCEPVELDFFEAVAWSESEECDYVNNILVFAWDADEAKEIAGYFDQRLVGEDNLHTGYTDKEVIACVDVSDMRLAELRAKV